MPVGEDIPMLIPISIVLTIFIVFLIALISNFSEQTDIVRLSQISLNVGGYLANSHPMSLGMGRISGSYLSMWCDYARIDCPNSCKSAKLNLLFDTSYNNIAVRIETNGTCWCWNQLSSDKEARVTNEFPVLIINGSKTTPAKVIVSVSK